MIKMIMDHRKTFRFDQIINTIIALSFTNLELFS